ncbi:MAG: hypothetical protein H7831_17960 [Magnetococcus sp. WYHC-3]
MPKDILVEVLKADQEKIARVEAEGGMTIDELYGLVDDGTLKRLSKGDVDRIYHRCRVRNDNEKRAKNLRIKAWRALWGSIICDFILCFLFFLLGDNDPEVAALVMILIVLMTGTGIACVILSSPLMED